MTIPKAKIQRQISELTSINNYDDEFQVVVKWDDCFAEEVLHLTGIRAPMPIVLAIIHIMSNVELKSYRKV